MRITQATYRPSPLRRVQSAGDSNHEQNPESKKHGSPHSEDVCEDISADTSEKAVRNSYVDKDGIPHIDTEA